MSAKFLKLSAIGGMAAVLALSSGGWSSALAGVRGQATATMAATSANQVISPVELVRKFDTSAHPLGLAGGLAVDKQDNVFVADALNNAIQKYDKDGKFVTQWGSYGTDNGQFSFFKEPPWAPVAFLAIDQEGNVYVSDSNNARIQKFDSNGKFLSKMDNAGYSDGQLGGRSRILGPIYIDAEDNIYVGDEGRLQKFDGNGKFLGKLGTRVSTEEQKEAGNSLPAQIARLKKYCQNKGFEIIKEFSFDESAYKDQRSDFDGILDFVIEQKEKIAVCFDKVDRLSRNVFDKRVPVLYEKALNDEIELHFISDGQVLNSQISAVEKFQFGISLGLAKYYSDAISDNVKRAQEQMLRSGIYPGKAPYGYKSITKSDGKKDKEIDEFASRIVQKAYELYATRAYSMDLLRKKLKEEYGVNWSHGFTDKVLKDHFYFGVMTWNNKMYRHKYQPIITQILFDQVQQIKAGFNKKRYKYAGKPYIFRGLLRCGHCGLAITPEMHKGHVYYHCTQYNGKHGAEWIREEDITNQLGRIFKDLQLPDEVIQQIVDTLNGVHQDKMDFQNTQFKELTKERQMTTTMMDNLYLDRLKGRITDEGYDKFYQSLRDKITEIDTRLSMLQEAEDNYYVTAKYLLELSKRAYELFARSEVDEKRQLLKLVLQNLQLDGKTVRYEAIKPFDTILDFKHHQSWLPRQDSNLQPSS